MNGVCRQRNIDRKGQDKQLKYELLLTMNRRGGGQAMKETSVVCNYSKNKNNKKYIISLLFQPNKEKQIKC